MTVPPDDLVYGNSEPLTSDRQIINWLRQERANLMERLQKVEAELAEERRGDHREPFELQGCEHCGKDHNLETMRMMSDCWFCEACVADFQKEFDACEHSWLPHTDEMGDAGRCCEKCSGFVRDEDFELRFGPGALLAHTQADDVGDRHG